jgi:hypothetical protein
MEQVTLAHVRLLLLTANRRKQPGEKAEEGWGHLLVSRDKQEVAQEVEQSLGRLESIGLPFHLGTDGHRVVEVALRHAPSIEH